MRLSERAIELPRLVLVAGVSVCMLGLAGLATLPKERTPRIKLPVIVVAVPNPGATPTTNEDQIVDKVEDEVDTSLDNLRDNGSVISQAVNGAAVMMFVFDEAMDVTEAKRDVESMINRVKSEFPTEAQQDPGPTVNDIAFDDFPIIQVIVAGGASDEQRRRVVDDLEARIEKVDGVAAVDVFGKRDREVQIELNPHLMTLYGFSYTDIESAIRRANMDAPSGSIESSRGEDQRVRSRTKLRSLDQIREVPLGSRSGKPVILSDLANVKMDYQVAKSMARYQGEEAAVLLVRAKTDIDVLATANTIHGLVNQFVDEAQGDQQVQIGVVRSQAREIGYMIDQLATSAAYGLTLVVLILWLALGWRNASLISISVPFALLGTAGFMWFARQSVSNDLTINNMTLFGMILVVGMVVDGCIIVGENIYRHRELGRSPIESAKRGIGEVGSSLVSAYLTTFAAFGPMFLVRGVMGEFLGQLPVVVFFALCSAMLVDHFLLPVLSMYMMKVPKDHLALMATIQEEHADDTTRSPEEIEIAGVEATAAASPIKQAYGRILSYALHHRLMVLALSIVITLTPVLLFMTGAVGMEFFPDTDVPIIEVYFELPLGSSMQKRTAKVAKQLEKAVISAIQPDEWYTPPGGKPVGPVTTIGEPGALNTRLDNEEGAGPEFGMIYIELKLAENRTRTAAQIRRAISDALPEIPGVLVRVKSPKEGPPAGAPILVRVLGRAGSSVTLEDLAQRAADIHALLAGMPGVFGVNMDYRPRQELEVDPNRTIASLFDIDAAQIATSVNYALDGVRVGQVDFDGTEEIDLRLRNQSASRDQVEDLANLPLRSPTGRIVSLAQVAQIQRAQSANVIRHYDGMRVINIRAQTEEGVLVDDVKAALITELRPDLSPAKQRALALDRGQRMIWSDQDAMIEFGGETEMRDEALEDLNIALLLAVAAMMLVLVIKFNSFIQPLIVLSSVPLSLVGVSFGLAVCGLYFSIAAMIGVVALSGIVVNDAIVLVDFINRLRNAGIPLERAVIYAGQLRLRPIFLTTVTTIGGLLPLGLNLAGGGEFFQPLTVAMMFGLGFATLLQLFVIPICCYSFDQGKGALDPTHVQPPQPQPIDEPPSEPRL